MNTPYGHVVTYMATQKKKRATVRVAAIEGLPELLRHKGISMDAVLKAAGVPHTILSSPDNRWTFTEMARVFDASVKLSQCETIGIELSQIQSLKVLGKISYLIQSAQTLGESLECCRRYFSLHQEGAVIEATVTHGLVTVSYETYDAECLMHRQDVELTLALMIKMTKAFIGDPLWSPASVHFRQPAPRNEGQLRTFFGCPVHFGDSFDGVKFPDSLLARPVIGADQVLFEILEQHCQANLHASQYETELVEKVRKLIYSGLSSGGASIEKVAAELALTPRTLQRRLADEGLSFNELFDQTRKQLSCTYIRDDRINLAEMAYMLGYADLPSFHRAFKRWHDMTPQQMRSVLRHETQDGAARSAEGSFH
jgi:AraC-like DNA-binding protein